MGLLTIGTPLSWEETKALAEHVRYHGVIQFINLYNRYKNRQGDEFKWGDEIEYIIIKFDNENKSAKVSLRSHEILPILNKKEIENPDDCKSLWRPEFTCYMIESSPGKPYGNLLYNFNHVEANMKYRRDEIAQLLNDDEVLFSITNFFRLGCPNFTDPPSLPTPNEGVFKSLFFPDKVLFPNHPRFENLTRNISNRRGDKLKMNVPDINTKIPIDDSYKYSDDALLDCVYLDAFGFGLGCCGLQITIQGWNMIEAKYLYDQLAAFCPIMLAITAATPVFRGFLTDVDSRWNVIRGLSDCRSKEERGLKPLNHNKFLINKTRCDSIDLYLSEKNEQFNDIPLVYDESIYNKLVENGVDHLLAQHVARLFIRDTISLFSEKIDQNDDIETDHYENIHSTHWLTMRFKAPIDSKTGWRVEFRPCEVQFSDFENAAICCFIVLLSRVILTFQTDLVIPISKVDENMEKAQKRNAVRTEQFWFSKKIFNDNYDKNISLYGLMTINEIFNGNKNDFPGLISLTRNYINTMDVDTETLKIINTYLGFIEKRASGEYMTPAAWIRNFIMNHKDYKNDSIISEAINYDLLKTINNIQNGIQKCPEMYGDLFNSKTNVKNINTSFLNTKINYIEDNNVENGQSVKCL